MCLGAVVRVVKAIPGAGTAECESGRVVLSVRIQLVEQVRAGDYLLVHAGYALAKVDQGAVEATREFLEELLVETPEAPPLGG